ncbi:MULTISPECIES: site-specific integrase [unclassified Aeromicrobium]|uniref:tyrosine-type recombinase/integrase n=1 Tax=unclassified Aeromicrobium TaxID=2633570 RepID=UPI00288C183A|nr:MULTISPECIES: site-specific integrase [unclassified Aeromicrobium]
MTDEAYRYALARADERERLMLRLAAECGLRRAEVAQVHTRDLVQDLDGWSLRVLGKGQRERVVPLPRGLAAELRSRPKGYIFPGDDHGHLSPRWVGTLVGNVLPDGWTMHKLRHRAATRWYAVDRDTFTVQDLLGHASPATTRAYVAIPNDSLRRTVEAAA